MKSQEHNKGELKDLKVSIETNVVDKLNQMSKNSGIPLEDMVCIALKRYITHHSDYLGNDSDPTQ